MAEEKERSNNSLPLPTYSAPGGLRQAPGCAAKLRIGARIYGNGSPEMSVLLSTYDSRGDVEPLLGLAARSVAATLLLDRSR